ncbi:hypothetical protein GCM10023142_05180 [Anaerocolumna aminovalerica]
MPGNKFTNNIPNAIGIRRSGSYPFFIARNKNIHAIPIIIKFLYVNEEKADSSTNPVIVFTK